jgi:6-phosphogluconolactonase (cycloisomerase 2 family)
MQHCRLGRREFVIGLGGMAATIAARSAGAPAEGFDDIQRSAGERGQTAAADFMYVGSFTGEGRGHGEGLSVYRRNGESDPWTLVQLLKDLADPSFLIVDRPKRSLYSAHGDGTQATAYRIDQTTGRLTVLNQQPTSGRNGVHLAIDASGRFLVVANYASGTVAVLPINQDGSLAPASDLATLSGTPGPHRTQQESSHPHHCPFDRTGRIIVVPDKGLDKVFVFRLDTARGKLVAGNPADVATRSGAAPRHVDFHPTLPYAYVINELDSTITTYQLDPDKGALKALQVVTTLPSSYTGNNSGAEIAVASSGRFLYGSNRGHDSIAIFAIDQSSGLLTSIGWEPTQGKTPRYFGLDPSGTHLYAANQNSDTIVIFQVDRATGKLMATGQIVKVASPTTVVFR